MTMTEFITDKQIANIWFVSHGYPAGCELIHNTDTEDPEDYCDLNEPGAIEFLGDTDDLEGEAEGDRWEWDCEGDITDWNRNTIRRLVVYIK